MGADARRRLVAADALSRALRLHRPLGDGRLSPAVRASHLRVSPGRPGLLSLLRRHGAAELDPQLGLRPPPASPLRRPRLGPLQHPAGRLVGAHRVDLLQEPGRTGSSTTCPDLQKNPLVQLPVPLLEPHRHRRRTRDPDADRLGLRRSRSAACSGAASCASSSIHHTTFFVNSIAHLYGTRPYTEANSARDNPWVALADQRRGVPQLPPPLSRRTSATASAGTSGTRASGGSGRSRAVGLARRLRRTSRLSHRALAPPDGVGRAEKELASTPSHLHEAIRHRLDRRISRSSGRPRSGTSLQARSRRDWKEYREHLAHARGQWREALGCSPAAPEGA